MSTKAIARPPIHPPFHRSHLEESKEESPKDVQFDLELERVKAELAKGTRGKTLAQIRKEKTEDLRIALEMQGILEAIRSGRDDLLASPEDQSEAACARELSRPAKPKKTNSRALSVGHVDPAATKKKAGRQASLSLGRKREEDDEVEQLHLTFMQKLQMRFRKDEADGAASPTSTSSAASGTSSRSPSSSASSVESAISPRSPSPASLPSTSESGASSRSPSPSLKTSLKTRLLTAFRAITPTRRAGTPTSTARHPSSRAAPVKQRPPGGLEFA